MKYGFIGAGNMAGAIIKGMTIGTNSFKGQDIYVTSKTQITAEVLSKECGVHAVTLKEIAKECDVIVLGVKPNVLADILPDVKESCGEKKPLFISIAAGKPLTYFEEFFDPGTAIVRVMPNINAKIGASTSGYCCNAHVTPEQIKIVTDMFSTIGSVMEIPEKQFSIFSVIGGASVAFAYFYMDALSRAALKAGMPKKLALEITANTVLGSAKMILESGEQPWPLIDQVCSPGGTTVEGVCTLEENGFGSTLVKAFDAVLEKDKKLGL